MCKNKKLKLQNLLELRQMDISRASFAQKMLCSADISDKNFGANRRPRLLANYHHLSTASNFSKLVSNSPQILITLPHGEICKLPRMQIPPRV